MYTKGGAPLERPFEGCRKFGVRPILEEKFHEDCGVRTEGICGRHETSSKVTIVVVVLVFVALLPNKVRSVTRLVECL